MGPLSWQKKDIVAALDGDVWDWKRKDWTCRVVRARPYVRGLIDGYEAKHYREILYLNIWTMTKGKIRNGKDRHKEKYSLHKSNAILGTGLAMVFRYHHSMVVLESN